MNRTKISLYDESTIDSLPWPEHVDAQSAKKFLVPLIKEGVHHFIDNVKTKLYVMLVGDQVLPITVNDEEYENSYVCSPYGHYVGYPLDSLEEVPNKIVRKLLKGVLTGLGKVSQKAHLNKAVVVNNWFFSTTIHPLFSVEQIEEITQLLTVQFPDKAIIFKSIHTFANNPLYDQLKECRFDLIASREVFFLKANEESIFDSRIFKSDLKHLVESHYEIQDISQMSQEDLDVAIRLYRAIYVDKHSKFNPQLNGRFIALALQSNLLHMRALHKEGCVDAIVGFWIKEGVMFSPILGYNSQPHEQNQSLYRMASTVLTEEARKRKLLFHLSSGASKYKRIRKGVPQVEYHAVYNDHLPLAQRFLWRCIKGLFNTIGIAVMKRRMQAE